MCPGRALVDATAAARAAGADVPAPNKMALTLLIPCLNLGILTALGSWP